MTDDQLISELERLDAAATKGPFEARDNIRAGGVTHYAVVHQSYPSNPGMPCSVTPMSMKRDEDYANGEMIALLLTYRHRLLALLRREKAGRELLAQARQTLIELGASVDSITAFLATEKA